LYKGGIKLKVDFLIPTRRTCIPEQNKRLLNLLILSLSQHIILLPVQNNNIQFIGAVINIKDKELISLLIIISPAILVENILILVVLESETFEVNVLHDFPRFV
jgi:hypothetical protein